MEHQKIAYSIKQLAKLTGICERKIHSEIKQGKLKKSCIGSRVVIRATEVDKWLEKAAN
jgi:excisionase family DNA binding protein